MPAKLVALAFAIVVLGGCSGWEPPDGPPPGMSISGDDHAVTVTTQWPSGDALPVAQAYCTARGGVPRLRSMSPNRAVYDCIPNGDEAGR